MNTYATKRNHSWKDMTSQERLLTALRRREPDRVPVNTWLNPYTKDIFSWTWKDPSYRRVLDCVRKYGDVCSCYFLDLDVLGDCCLMPRNLKYSQRRFKNQNGEEELEIRVKTPKGFLTHVRQTRFGGYTRKYWVESEKDLERLLSVPWHLKERDFSDFLKNRKILGEKGLIQVALVDPASVLGIVNHELRAIWSIEKRHLIRTMLDVAFKRQMEVWLG